MPKVTNTPQPPAAAEDQPPAAKRPRLTRPGAARNPEIAEVLERFRSFIPNEFHFPYTGELTQELVDHIKAWADTQNRLPEGSRPELIFWWHEESQLANRLYQLQVNRVNNELGAFNPKNIARIAQIESLYRQAAESYDLESNPADLGERFATNAKESIRGVENQDVSPFAREESLERFLEQQAGLLRQLEGLKEDRVTIKNPLDLQAVHSDIFREYEKAFVPERRPGASHRYGSYSGDEAAWRSPH